jgi:hypothetical protein
MILSFLWYIGGYIHVNNKMTKNGSEKGGSMNSINLEVGTMSSNVVNHALGTEIGSEIPEELGQPKHKRVLQQLADALNRCLCKLVLNISLGGVVKCKQAGCETQWVIIDSWYTSSITSSVWVWRKSHKISCAWLVRHWGKDMGESTHGDDVTFPYLYMFLIM